MHAPTPNIYTLSLTTLFRSGLIRLTAMERELADLTGRKVDLRTPHDLSRYFRSEEHTSELQSRGHLVCRLLLEKKKMAPKNPMGKPKRDRKSTRLNSSHVSS